MHHIASGILRLARNCEGQRTGTEDAAEQGEIPLAEQVYEWKGPCPLAVVGLVVALFLIWSSPTQGQPTTCPALEAQQQRELEMTAQDLLRVVRQADIEGLISLLADEVETATDIVVTKQELARTLRRREGIKYISLYDTPRYRGLVKEWRKKFTPRQRAKMPPIDSALSVQDHLLKADGVRVRLCPWPPGEGQEYTSAVVGFDWPGRPSLVDLPNSLFILTNSGWRISMLFSLIGW